MSMLGDRIRSLRRVKGYSQEELATRAGLSVRSIQDYERDSASPSIDAITSIASELETSIDYLAGLTDDPSPRPNELTDEERAVLSLYRQLRENQRAQQPKTRKPSLKTT